jgi:hypothetical protein
VIGLNHYRDSTLPPFHKLILNAKNRWPDKPLWFTETSGPPLGWKQEEWFWWMLAETRLANDAGADIPVFNFHFQAAVNLKALSTAGLYISALADS